MLASVQSPFSPTSCTEGLKVQELKYSLRSILLVSRHINDACLVLSRVSAANLHSLYIMATQKLPSIVDKMDVRGKLTFYSLYKQINDGDADLFPDTHKMTSPPK
jgi:hypothetical protein